jgi:hypothetical protein
MMLPTSCSTHFHMMIMVSNITRGNLFQYFMLSVNALCTCLESSDHQLSQIMDNDALNLCLLPYFTLVVVISS